ncbi:MAG: zinc ribbon domain-containing protein [Tepidisphaeraceae bacterium]
MGPTNQALVKVYFAELQLRDAQERLATVTKNVRVQENKVSDLATRQAAAKADLLQQQARAGELDLEVRSRDTRIEQLREQQNQAQTNREYQAHLVQINTQKVDKAKFEEEALGVLEKIEQLTKDSAALTSQLEAETERMNAMRAQIDGRVKTVTGEIDALRPVRDEAAAAVPEKVMQVFQRLADRYDGEAMEAIDKPHPKREEYIATTCNIDLTVDVYNRLHTRDDLVFCPGCGRILFIPEGLTPEKAVHKPKEKKARKPKADLAAPVQLQTLASSVVSSVDEEENEAADASEPKA